MNPVAELLGAVSSGAEARLPSRPQKGAGEFQLALDEARRALQRDEAAGGAPRMGEASQPAHGGERLPGSRPAEFKGEKPGEALAADDEQAGSRPGGADSPEGGEASQSLPGTVALMVNGAAASLPGEASGAGIVPAGGVVQAVAQVGAAPPVLGTGARQPEAETQLPPSPGQEAGRNLSGGQPAGQAPVLHAAPHDQPGATGLVPARAPAEGHTQAGGAPGPAARARGAARAPSGQHSVTAGRALGPEHMQPFARPLQGASQEPGPQTAPAQPQGQANGVSFGSPLLDGARSELAFLFRSPDAAPAEGPVAPATSQGLQPDGSDANPVAPGRLEAAALSGEELSEAAPTGGADEAEATAARPARENAGQLQRHDGAMAVRTEPPPQGEAAPSLPAYARTSQAFEGSRFAPLARPALQQMVRSAEAQIGDEVSTLHLQLRPANLGDLDLRLSVEHGVLTAKFVTHSLEVKALIESALPELRQSLQEQGVAVDQLTVSVGEERHLWDDRGREAYGRGSGTGPGYVSRASFEAGAPAAAAASSPRMWYSQGVDILV